MDGRRWVGQVSSLFSIVALLVVACGAPTPATTGFPSGSSGSAAAPSIDASSPGAPGLIPYDQATAVAAAQAEVDDIDALRRTAGIAALIGPAGPTVLANVDAAKVDNAAKRLPEVAKMLGLDLSFADRRIASTDGLPVAPAGRDDIEWTGSLLGQVSATTSMMMALLPEAIGALAGTSADARGGAPIDKIETYPEKTHDGVTEKVTIRTRVRVTAGGGKIALDLDINSVDTISDQATGAEVARLEGNSHGHIDVNACPDRDGVSPGTYELSLQEELVRPGSTGAGDAKVIKAPFKFIDGDDAKLVRIEGNLDITQHAHGPAAAGAGAFDWSVGATVPEVIQANGTTTAPQPAVQTDGDPSQAQIDNTTGGRSSAENYLKVLAKETEAFWRSGKCIDLKPSDDTRKVKPGEKVDLTVKALGKFDGQEIAKPIVATFTGTKSLDPTDRPVDEPAKFSFEAGDKKDDKGTIDLKQVSNRGIGRRQVVYTVALATFSVEVVQKLHQDLGLVTYDTTIHLAPVDLVPADGAYKAHATVDWTTTFKAAPCTTKTYTGSFTTDVMARVDPADETRLLIRAVFIPGVLKTETLVCKGRQYTFTGSTSLGAWTFLLSELPVTIGGSYSFDRSMVGGTGKTTITVRKKNP